MSQIVKFLLEGLAVSMASHLVAGNKLNVQEIILLGLTAAAVFMVLEFYAPSIVAGARQGAGFGIGMNMVGGGTEESAEAIHVPEESVPDSPYKLIDGMYARKVLLAGFNQNAKAANDCDVYYPWSIDVQTGGEAGTQTRMVIDGLYTLEVPISYTGVHRNTTISIHNGTGLADDTSIEIELLPSKMATFTMSSRTIHAEIIRDTSISAYDQYLIPYDDGLEYIKLTLIAEPTHQTESTEQPQQSQETQDRRSDALYSGDLIDIMVDGDYMQRGATDSQIIFDRPIPKVITNLSKLRLVHPDHSPTQQTVLNYGETVYIMHNAYVNNQNQPKFIKYGERLQSHQDGTSFHAFKIYDANNRNKRGAIEPGAEIYLCRGEGEHMHLRVEDDKTVSSNNDIDAATRFKIILNRVFEPHDRNLCVCSNEIIYP